jgi:hypothetical protein
VKPHAAQGWQTGVLKKTMVFWFFKKKKTKKVQIFVFLVF